MIKYLFIILFPFLSFGQIVFSEADSLFQNKEYLNAENALRSILDETPNDKKSLKLLGETYAAQEKWDEAVLVFKKLVDIDPESAEYHYKYGGAMGMQAVRNNAIAAFFMIDDVRDEFLITIELDKNHIDAHWALVVFYTELPGIIGGSYKKAFSYSNELKTISLVDHYLSKGYIYEHKEEAEQAEINYLKAVEVGGSFTCFQKLSSLYENEGEPQKAINTIEKANNKLQRNSLNYQLGKVSAAYNLELEKGENCLLKYIDNYKPEDGIPLEWPYYRLAQIYRHKNDKASALKWIEKSLNFQPEFEPAQEEKELILKL